MYSPGDPMFWEFRLLTARAGGATLESTRPGLRAGAQREFCAGDIMNHSVEAAVDLTIEEW